MLGGSVSYKLVVPDNFVALLVQNFSTRKVITPVPPHHSLKCLGCRMLVGFGGLKVSTMHNNKLTHTNNEMTRMGIMAVNWPSTFHPLKGIMCIACDITQKSGYVLQHCVWLHLLQCI